MTVYRHTNYLQINGNHVCRWKKTTIHHSAYCRSTSVNLILIRSLLNVILQLTDLAVDNTANFDVWRLAYLRLILERFSLNCRKGLVLVWFWFYYALWLASVFTLVLVLRQSSENRSISHIYTTLNSPFKIPYYHPWRTHLRTLRIKFYFGARLRGFYMYYLSDYLFVTFHLIS